jgi:predicted MFS family arabinose efflux permease
VLAAAEGSVLGASGLVAVLAVAAAMAVAFGHIDTALAATARERLGDPARLGLLFAAIAGGSATGGLVYGARRWRWRPERQLPLLLGAFGLALAALPAVVAADPVPLVVLLPLLFLAGLPIAPSLIVQQNLVDDLAPSHRSAEAQAWLSSAATTAAAAGTAVCGVLLDVAGVPWALAAAALAAGCSALVALGAIVGGASRA